MCEQSEKFNKETKVIKKKVPNRNSAIEEFNEWKENAIENIYSRVEQIGKQENRKLETIQWERNEEKF